MHFFSFSENDTVNYYFRDKRWQDCYLEVYTHSQEGMKLVKKIEADFDDGNHGYSSMSAFSIHLTLHSRQLHSTHQISLCSRCYVLQAQKIINDKSCRIT